MYQTRFCYQAKYKTQFSGILDIWDWFWNGLGIVSEQDIRLWECYFEALYLETVYQGIDPPSSLPRLEVNLESALSVFLSWSLLYFFRILTEPGTHCTRLTHEHRLPPSTGNVDTHIRLCLAFTWVNSGPPLSKQQALYWLNHFPNTPRNIWS